MFVFPFIRHERAPFLTACLRRWHRLAWVAALLMMVAVLTSAWAQPGAAQAQDDPVLARFANGETISHADLLQYVNSRLDLRGRVRTSAQANRALHEMALTRSLNLEAGEVGVEPLADRANLRFDDILAQAVSRKLVPDCQPLAGEAAARAYFDNHPDEFTMPATIRLVRIKLPASAVLDGQPAMDWLQAKADVLRQDPAALDDVADEAYSVYSREPQGDLGWMPVQHDDDAPVVTQLNKAGKGQWVGPIQIRTFVYLFQVRDRREAHKLTWEQVGSSVPQQALNSCRDRRERILQEKMFGKYGVTFDEKALRRLYP